MFEQWRRGRQEKRGREDVADRLNELEERDRSKDKYYGEALGGLEKELIKLRGKSGLLPGSSPKILPEKPAVLQEKDDEEDERPKGWFLWFRSKTIGADNSPDEGGETENLPETAVNAPEAASTTPSQNQALPSPSTIEKVRQRAHPRDISPKSSHSSTETSRTLSSSGSKPSQ